MDTEFLFYIVFMLLRGYYYLLILYIILSWVVDTKTSVLYQTVGVFCDPFFRIFRGLLVFGGMDFTPMLGLILYQLALGYIVTLY